MARKRRRLVDLNKVSLTIAPDRASTPTLSIRDEEHAVLDNFSDFNPSDEG